MAQNTPSRTLDKVIVRLPDGMRDRLMSEARVAGRTMNAEIVQRLEASFTSPPLAAGERIVLDLLETLARIDPNMMRGVLAEVEMRVRDTRKPRP